MVVPSTYSNLKSELEDNLEKRLSDLNSLNVDDTSYYIVSKGDIIEFTIKFNRKHTLPTQH